MAPTGLSTTPVHPRACGERVAAPDESTITDGSSPRVRGTVRSQWSHFIYFRFIPARAGNGSYAFPRSSRRPVHPRACGERNVGASVPPSMAGSSPRVRGTVRDGDSAGQRRRFIPARAGNGLPLAAREHHRPVHPRACGERHAVNAGDLSWAGSSPRVRGTVCALFMRVTDLLSVHPRACGERPGGGLF